MKLRSDLCHCDGCEWFEVVDLVSSIGISLQIRSIVAFTIASLIWLLFVRNCISINPRFKRGSQISSHGN